MHSGEITIDSITKIEGSAGLKVTIADDKVTDLKFIYRITGDFIRTRLRASRLPPPVISF